MKGYIKSSKAITAQDSFEGEFPFPSFTPPSLKMLAREPEYKKYLPPMKIRRMSRIVRMGLTPAMEALKDAGVENPDAIITATGWGCLADTHKFLTEMGEKDEQTLSPATFIQSTHNTVGGQIALMLQCQEYNSVYVHHTASFEHSLLDAMMLLAEGKANVLVGGVDEIMDADYDLKRRSGYWKSSEDSLGLPTAKTAGTLAGEGGIFFVLTSSPGNNQESCVQGTVVSSQPNPGQVIFRKLQKWGIKPDEIDILLSGLDGNAQNNEVYKSFRTQHFSGAVHTYYKHVFGDFDTSSAAALWLSDNILKSQSVPEIFLMPGESVPDRPIKNILIHHYTKPEEHAFILVSKTGI